MEALGILLIVLLVIYGVCAVAVFIGVMITFFKRHPDGAVELTEADILWYVFGALVTSAFWFVVLIGMWTKKHQVGTRS